MAITLPPAPTANAETAAANAANVIAAQSAFVAYVTVLINDAITNGLFAVEPLAVPLVTSDFVTSYFEPLGYTVLFPLIPNYPYNPAFIPGFPEVLPPGYQVPLSNPNGAGPPRYKISWNGA